MQYQGGKWRMRKDISHILKTCYENTLIDFDGYIEPFVGGGSVLSEICKWFPKQIIASDLNEDLIVLWKALKGGWLPPDNLSEQEYNELKNSPNDFKSALKTFALIGCSFGAKWKGGYARNKEGQNYANAAFNSLNLKMESIKNTNCQFVFCSYDTHQPINKIIYCDPPYRNTTGYKGVVGRFDYSKFDDWCRVVGKDNLVIVSEYNMPSDFHSIFEKLKPNSLQAQTGKTETMIEKVFIYEDSLKLLK